MNRRIGTAAVALGAILIAACGNGEDRPRGVTAEDSEAAGHDHSASASGTGSSSASGSSASGSASHAHEGGAPPSPAFDQDEADQAVAVAMTEFAFAFDAPDPVELRGPKLYLSITNDGEIEHELVVFDDEGREVAAMPPLDPGASAPLTVAAGPGTYRVRCLLTYGYETHATLGMERDVTITER